MKVMEMGKVLEAEKLKSDCLQVQVEKSKHQIDYLN